MKNSYSKKIFEKIFSTQSGQVAIIVGLALVALIGMLAYVIDEGSLYQERRMLQSVADSSALAAVQELPENPDLAIQKAIEYAAIHNVVIDSSDIAITSTYVEDDTVTVAAKNMDKQLFFAGIFGKNTTPVGAKATAIVGSPSGFFGAVPWAVLEEDWVPGNQYVLKFDANPGQDKDKGEDKGGDQTFGNFQALAIGGKGANHYEDVIADGANVTLKVGDYIDTETGNMEGPTIRGTERRIYQKPDYALNSFSELVNVTENGYELKYNDSQFVMCPVIEDFPHGRKDVLIIKFVPFVITELRSSEVVGVFLNKALIVYNGGIVGVDDSGFRVTRLIN